MEVKGEYTFDAPREVVWEYLQDPQVLAKVLPGCEELKTVADDEYEGALKVKIGPVQGTFQGNVKIMDLVPPESYNIKVSGKGAPGFANGTGGLRLEDQGDKTHMTYQGEAQIGGRIASVGQRLIDSSSRAIIKQGLDALNKLLQARSESPETAPAETPSEASEPTAAAPQSVTAAPEPPASAQPTPPPAQPARPAVIIPPDYKPPSQNELALNVAADVLEDFIPPRFQPLVAGAAGGALVLLLYFLARAVLGGAGDD